MPLLAVAAIALVAVGAGMGAMTIKKLGPRLCETTGGGRFVKIPGFPGEKIDRRLLNDIRFLRQRWPIFITDGYSLDPVHSANGEHPIGLALDIVPDESEGGRWRHITDLAEWAEPQQDRPRAPFRWVGYDGDAHHGRGHHLHLSWSHSPAQYDKPARRVYTIRCPFVTPRDGGGDGGGGTGGTGTDGGGGDGDNGTGGTGGISVRKADRRTSGGIETRGPLEPVRRETGGVSA